MNELTRKFQPEKQKFSGFNFDWFTFTLEMPLSPAIGNSMDKGIYPRDRVPRAWRSYIFFIGPDLLLRVWGNCPSIVWPHLGLFHGVAGAQATLGDRAISLISAKWLLLSRPDTWTMHNDLSWNIKKIICIKSAFVGLHDWVGETRFELKPGGSMLLLN